MGLTSLISLPANHIPPEALERIFKATLELLVSYKDQVAGSILSFVYFLMNITIQILRTKTL